MFPATARLNMKAYQVRRSGQVARFGEISLDFRKMELQRAGQLVPLTLLEFKILKFFISRPESVVSREILISAAWQSRKRSTARTVDNHIASLRKKLEEDPAHPVLFRTVRGVGYKFVPQARPRDAQQDKDKPVTEEGHKG
jgi:two-component system alkaline phosphatase synthesis response regulator PhoP